jgi:RHS repeat-associated protein
MGGTWISPVYDAAANMTQAPKPGAETTRIWLKYDAWNRLAEVDADSGGSPGAALGTYRYDGLNRRISKTAGTDTLDYYYNENWQVLEVRKNGSSNPLEQWVWDQRYIDAPVLRWHDSNTDGTVDDTLYACNDANMNVTALVDATTNNVVERYAYDPYGKVRVMDGSWGARASSSYGWDVLYGGYSYDNETELYNVRNRYYLPSLGTWMGRDALQSAPGSNLYEYVSSNPPFTRDPWGLAQYECQKTGVRVRDTKWRYLKTIPGNAIGGTNAGDAPVGAVQAYFRGVYYLLYYEQLKCCDATDSPYFSWHLRAVVGTADAWKTEDSRTAYAASLPIPIPLPYGQSVQFSGLSQYWWGAGETFNWANHPPVPTKIVGSPPLNPNRPGDTKYKLVGKISCCGKFPATSPRPAPPFPP